MIVAGSAVASSSTVSGCGPCGSTRGGLARGLDLLASSARSARRLRRRSRSPCRRGRRVRARATIWSTCARLVLRAASWRRQSSSTEPSRSSSVANIIVVARACVRILLAPAVMMPPTVTQSPSLRSASSASGPSTLASSASRTSLSGCTERKSPIASFSMAEQLGLLELLGRGSAGATAANAAAAPLRSVIHRRGRRSSPGRSRRRAGAFWPADCACSSTSSMPLREAPVEPNAPHLISASIERLLTARGSTRSQKSQIDSNGPLSSRPP